MIPVADPFMADARPTGLQRGRGGFLRAANDTPWVTHPDGTIVNSGPRKGERLRVAYAQPSGAGRLIENDVGLTKFKQRNTLLGIGMNEALREACKDLALMEAGGDEFRKAADTIVVEADNLTRSWLAADRGSHGHLLCELWDKGRPHVTIPPDVIRAGEALGLGVKTQATVGFVWHNILADNGLEILAIEASCVDDRWRLAGTLDRIVRCTRELRFAKPDGTIIVIPAGTVLILDIKFGVVRRAHLIQCASYRQSVPYDTDLETRGVWPWEISADHALIAHGDFGGDGTPVSFELVWIDLAAGREHGGQCVADAKTWSARDDLWSVAQLIVGVGDRGTATLTPTTDVEGEGLAVDGTNVLPSPSTPVSPQATQSPAAVNAGGAGSADPTRPPATIELDCESTSTHSSAGGTDPSNGASIHPGISRASGDEISKDDRVPPALECADSRAEALAWASQPAPAPLPALPANPDEGLDLSVINEKNGGIFTALERDYKALDAISRAWISRLVSEAQQAGVGFHAQSAKTERRYHIIRGLVDLANREIERNTITNEDDVLRVLVTGALGRDVFDPRHTPGHVVGCLNAEQADRFAGLVDAFVAAPQDLATPVA